MTVEFRSARTSVTFRSQSSPAVSFSTGISVPSDVPGDGAALSDSDPADLGTAAPGVATEASRADHVHNMPAAALADLTDVDVVSDPPAQDDVLAWDGANWTPATLDGGVELGETSTTAYRGDRGKTAYDHSQVTTGNPHGTTAADVGALPDDTVIPDISGLQPTSAKDQADGYAGLDSNARVAQARLGSGSSGAGTKFLADDQTYKTVTASETLAATIIDAKGDLIVGTADNTAARLAVGGTNGQTLTVSSGATPGVAWTAPGPPMVIPSGRYSLGGPWTTTTAAATFMDAGYMIGTLMYLPPGQSFDRLGVLISASGASGATLRVGIYNIGSNGYPTTQLVAHSGTLNCGSGGLKEATVSFAGVGWCWGVWQTAGAAVSSRAPSPTPMQAPLYVAESHTTHNVIYAARSDAALPSDLTAQSWTLAWSTPHGIQVRAA